MSPGLAWLKRVSENLVQLTIILLAFAAPARANVMPYAGPTPAIAPCTAAEIQYYAKRYPGSGIQCTGVISPNWAASATSAPNAAPASAAKAAITKAAIAPKPALVGGLVKPNQAILSIAHPANAPKKQVAK